jgi:hypothetical protein
MQIMLVETSKEGFDSTPTNAPERLYKITGITLDGRISFGQLGRKVAEVIPHFGTL